MPLKYVIVETDLGDCSVVFGSALAHDAVARAMVRELGGSVVSAGFCNLREDDGSGYPAEYKTCAYGGSTSLDLVSRPEDERILEITLK